MNVQIIDRIEQLRTCVTTSLRLGRTVGLVPTMGALHAGHISLIDRAVGDCELVIVSLFVNPTQFNKQNDFEGYPRTREEDLLVCEQQGVDVVFAPSVKEMYTGSEQTIVDVSYLTDHLCGLARPGHFRGVATVVAKLLNITRADFVYFGEKDAQQLAVVRRMVEDLNIPTQSVAVPTVREADGLALSSRNQHLTDEDRKVAVVIYNALVVAKDAIVSGEKNAAVVLRIAREKLQEQPLARVEYFEIVDAVDMQPVEVIRASVRAVTAVWVGGTRLIDNVLCCPNE